MRRSLLLALFTLLAGCHGTRAAPPGSPVVRGAAADTVDVLHAVWRAATVGIPAERVAWLHLPDADTAALSASAGVRAALAARGVPASARLPAGDDTVVFRVRRWVTDSGGAPRLDLVSTWTTVRRMCRYRSGNVAWYRVRRTPQGWSAELSGPTLHGDAACSPLR